MQRFFLFMALLAAIVFAADFTLTKLFDSLYERVRTGQTGGEINHYLSLPEPPKALIMGNSRARYQVDPDSFAIPTYSLCHAGMGQVFQTGLLQVLAKEKKLPAVIMLHVDFEEYAGEDNLEDIGNLRYYYQKIPAITTLIDEVSTFEKVKYLFRLYRYNGRIISTLKNFMQSRNYPYSSNGYQSLAPIANDSATFTEAPLSIHSSRPRFHYQNLRHLEEFITECKHRNIKLLCFTSPYFSTPAFASAVAPHIDSLLKAQQIPYLNTSVYLLPVLKHHASFWQDGVHLNQLGAGYLSRQLAQWSKPYLVADTASGVEQ